MSLKTMMPIYVTRKNANEETGTIDVAIWIALLIFFIITINILGWGIYSLFLLAEKVV